MHEHKFVISDKEGFEKCEECGSYHSVEQGNPKEIYEEKPYWDNATGHSTWDEQIGNLTETETCGISKVNKLIGYLPQRKPVLEIACAPGVILKALYENGYDVFGIEPNKEYFGNLWHQCPQAKLIHGYFPECTKNIESGFFDYIIASDVLEHVDDYVGFIEEAHRLLSDGGKAIIMSPIILDDGQYRERDFHKVEHAWIHTQEHIEEVFYNYFTNVEFSRWIVGHEIIIATK